MDQVSIFQPTPLKPSEIDQLFQFLSVEASPLSDLVVYLLLRREDREQLHDAALFFGQPGYLVQADDTLLNGQVFVIVFGLELLLRYIEKSFLTQFRVEFI